MRSAAQIYTCMLRALDKLPDLPLFGFTFMDLTLQVALQVALLQVLQTGCYAYEPFSLTMSGWLGDVECSASPAQAVLRTARVHSCACLLHKPKASDSSDGIDLSMLACVQLGDAARILAGVPPCAYFQVAIASGGGCDPHC